MVTFKFIVLMTVNIGKRFRIKKSHIIFGGSEFIPIFDVLVRERNGLGIKTLIGEVLRERRLYFLGYVKGGVNYYRSPLTTILDLTFFSLVVLVDTPFKLILFHQHMVPPLLMFTIPSKHNQCLVGVDL